jgi:long-chain acyl-CoA synthetase
MAVAMIGGTIGDRFDRTASRLGARIAVREPERDWSHADVLRFADGVSRALTAIGTRPGARVALMAPNSAAFVAGFYGIVRVGGVVAPLNVRYRDQELVYYLQDTGASALLAAPELIDTVRPALGTLAHAPALFVLDAGECRPVAPGGADSPALPPGDSPPLLQQYTSGSTGAPKRVIRTHAHLQFELERLAAVFRVSEEDRFLGAAPFSHVNGLVRTMMTATFAGATLYPLRQFHRRGALELIARERLTYFGAVPYMFVVLADAPLRGAVDLSSLRTVFSASAPLLPDDNRRFQAKYGRWVRQLYGSTETGTISVNLDPDPAARLESVGRPLPDVRVDVVDERHRPVAPGIEGEVAIASPGAIRAYAGNAEATAASFRDGVYLSGDLGRMDADGHLTLTGRRKFLINRGGFKVNPLEVEEAIRSHPKVHDVAVVGAPGAHGDDVVRCVVVASAPCAAEEIVRHCEGRIADYKIPSRIEFRDELPKSETGKLLRQKL